MPMKRSKNSRSTFADVGVLRRFGQLDMRDAERRRIAAQLGKLFEQLRIGRAREQAGEQRIFLRAREIDVIDVGFAVEIGPQNRAADAAHGFHREHALGGYSGPIGDGGLGDADAARKFGDAADGANGFLQSPVRHGRFSLLFSFARPLAPCANRAI